MVHCSFANLRRSDRPEWPGSNLTASIRRRIDGGLECALIGAADVSLVNADADLGQSRGLGRRFGPGEDAERLDNPEDCRGAGQRPCGDSIGPLHAVGRQYHGAWGAGINGCAGWRTG
jgi:hypothetical protein